MLIGHQMNILITDSSSGRKKEQGRNNKAEQRQKRDGDVIPVLNRNKRCRDAGYPEKSAQQMHEPPG